jgi:hypothetical protein
LIELKLYRKIKKSKISEKKLAKSVVGCIIDNKSKVFSSIVLVSKQRQQSIFNKVAINFLRKLLPNRG